MLNPNQDAVIVSKQSFDSTDSSEIIDSNISFLNALFEEHLTADEVSQDALRSYYVDYYLAEVQNGGFSQFVYNSGWNREVLGYVIEGLNAIGAAQQLGLFAANMLAVDGMDPDKRGEFLGGSYFGENPTRDALNSNDVFFRDFSKQEDLRELNAAWLRSLPNLVVLTESEIGQEIARRAAAIPDRDRRIALAREREPRYVKLIRALCAKAGQTLSHVTAGDPNHKHDGRAILAWHFITDQSHHHMIEIDGKALMFRGHSGPLIAEIQSGE